MVKVCALIPSYNCAHILPDVLREVTQFAVIDEVIVVDDASADNTLESAAGFEKVYAERNPKNLGYGGTSKRLYEIAVARGADIAINLHGDMGHRPSDIPTVLAPLLAATHDISVGSRLMYLKRLGQTEGRLKLLTDRKARFNMPILRMMGHFVLTGFQNSMLGTRLLSFHEGMRACNKGVMQWALKQKFNTWYKYDTEFIVGAAWSKFSIAETPIAPNYLGHSRSSAPPFKYGVEVVKYTLRAMKNRPGAQ